MRPIHRALGVLLLGAVAFGCGGNQGLDVASTQLKAKVADVRTAAESGSRDATAKAISALAAMVDSQVATGQLSAERATNVRAAMNEVMQALPAPTTTTTTSTTAPPASEEGPPKGKHGHKGGD